MMSLTTKNNICIYCKRKLRRVKNFGSWNYPNDRFHYTCHFKNEMEEQK